MDSLVKAVKKIEMPDDMRKRIADNCYRELIDMDKADRKQNMSNEVKLNNEKMNHKLEKSRMNSKHKNRFFKQPLIVAATFVLCICLTGITTLAATGKLQGFFKDIKNWNGAITGITYEQATDEITVSIEEAAEELSILVIIKEPDNIPYVYSEQFGINDYKIEDMSGKVIINESSYQERTTFNHQMSFNIPLNQIESGKYKLVIEQFVSEKKADQPLIINGNWECEFEF